MGFTVKKGFWEGFSEGVLRRGSPQGAYKAPLKKYNPLGALFWIRASREDTRIKCDTNSLAEPLCRDKASLVGQKSMGNKFPWKIGMLAYLPATARPLISLQKEAVLSPRNFAPTHLTACILNFHHPLNSWPMKRRTPSQRPKKGGFAATVCDTLIHIVRKGHLSRDRESHLAWASKPHIVNSGFQWFCLVNGLSRFRWI